MYQNNKLQGVTKTLQGMFEKMVNFGSNMLVKNVKKIYSNFGDILLDFFLQGAERRSQVCHNYFLDQIGLI